MNTQIHSEFIFDIEQTDLAPFNMRSLRDPCPDAEFDADALRGLARLAIDQLNAVKLRMRQDPTLTDDAHRKALNRIARQETYAWALLDELSRGSNP